VRGVKTRKQIYELTLRDIHRFPVWEYAMDEEGRPGQDEATVRPVELSDVDLRSSSYHVRARFTLADGTELLGLVTVRGQIGGHQYLEDTPVQLHYLLKEIR
jgi:hypothetical protein